MKVRILSDLGEWFWLRVAHGVSVKVMVRSAVI